jgi:hypothetical protein
VALRLEDLAGTPEGLRVTTRRSKTDQEGAGQEIAILRGLRPRPVEALRARLAAAGITDGGFLSSGAEAGASIFKLMEVSRHESVDTRGYVRRAELFKDHAGSALP